jgi:hypothetical protein
VAETVFLSSVSGEAFECPRKRSSDSPDSAGRPNWRRKGVSPTERRLVVGLKAAPLRRELGPLAWFVLEELVLVTDKDPRTGELSAAVGVRDLAASLGMSKDTAARGVARLIAARVVRRVDNRTSTGRFGGCRYVLSLPGGIARLAPEHDSARQRREESAERTPRRVHSRTSAQRRGPSRQLSLIDS